jgi:hypothetical protein
VSTALDQILERTSRLAGAPSAWVLYVHPEKKVAWAPQPETPWRKILLRGHGPNLWGLPGGPISEDESAEQAARGWAETQTGMACGVFSQSFDVGNDRVFVAPVLGRTPLELLLACNAETFWIGHDTVLGDFPQEVIHSAARAACERTDDLILQPLTEENTMATRSEFIAAQAKADRVANAYGDAAPAPMTGETLMAYRARLASVYQKFSKSFKDSDLHRIGDPSAMAGIEDTIYNDAMAEARHPTAASLAPGQLRAITTMDASNRPVTRYHGDIAAFMDQFNPPHRYITRFNTPGRS